MTAAEVHELAFLHIQFAHQLGESVNNQTEFWVSVSYAVLVLAFIAPHVLNKVTTPLILCLYITYTVAIGSNLLFDLDTSKASMMDAEKLLVDNGIELATFDEKIRAQRDANLTTTQEIGRLHVPGLFLATVGYVCFASYSTWRKRHPRPE